MPEKVTKRVRGLDAELYRKTKAAAAARGITMGQWINEAMLEKIHIHDAGKQTEIQTYCPICKRVNGEHDEGCPNA